MEEDLRKKAKKRVEAKMTVYIVAVIFSFAAAILMVLSFILPSVAIWLRLAIFVLAMTLGFLYLLLIALPNYVFSKEWREEEIEQEVAKLSRRRRKALPTPGDLSEEDRLELKEFERLRQKWDGDL